MTDRGSSPAKRGKNVRMVQICGFALIISTLLVSMALSTFVSSASIASTTTVNSGGNVQYPGPPGTNFADVPADWRVGETWNAPTYLDYNVLHNGNPSIRIEKGADATKSREILCADYSQSDWCIRVKPGDHIVFKVWMKTSASSIGDTTPESGIRFGIDFYGANGYINGCPSPDGQTWTPAGGFATNQHLNYVQWGHDWQQRTMDFIVQAQYPMDLGTATPGTMRIPTKIIPWVQIWSGHYGNADDGVAWFADAELYINP